MRDIWEREKRINPELAEFVNMFLQTDPANRPSIN